MLPFQLQWYLFNYEASDHPMLNVIILHISHKWSGLHFVHSWLSSVTLNTISCKLCKSIIVTQYLHKYNEQVYFALWCSGLFVNAKKNFNDCIVWFDCFCSIMIIMRLAFVLHVIFQKQRYNSLFTMLIIFVQSFKWSRSSLTDLSSVWFKNFCMVARSGYHGTESGCPECKS